MTLPDVVYVVRPGDANGELRYSLRSVAAHLPHRRVWLVGWCPTWVTGVTHIVLHQGRHKHTNTLTAWRAIATHDGISDHFVLLDDDVFLMRPMVGPVPALHGEPLAQWCDRLSDVGELLYHRASTTVDLFDRAGISGPRYHWERHVPMPLHRPSMAAALSAADALAEDLDLSTGLAKRTWVANHSGMVGTPSPDFKIRTRVQWERAGESTGVADWPYLSTDDETFRTGPVGRYVRARFPTPGPYEIDQPVKREVQMRFVSLKYPDLAVPSIGVRFRRGVADVTARGAVAYLSTPFMRRRGVHPATEVDPADLPEGATETPQDPESAPGRLVSEPAPTEAVTRVPTGSVAEVVEWVNGDPDRARDALRAEQGKDRPRTTLIDTLTRIIED